MYYSRCNSIFKDNSGVAIMCVVCAVHMGSKWMGLTVHTGECKFDLRVQPYLSLAGARRSMAHMLALHLPSEGAIAVLTLR